MELGSLNWQASLWDIFCQVCELRTLTTMTKNSDGRSLRFEQLESRQVLSTVTLSPVADTFTHAGVNAGTATTLETRDLNGAGGDYMAYLRFDLSGIDLTGLTNAYLTLQKVGGATIVIDRFDVFGLSNLAGNTPQDWNEATLANGGLGAEYANTGGNYIDLSRVVNLSSEGTSGANVIEQVTNSGPPQFLSGVDLVNFLQTRKADGGLATFIALVDAGADRNLIYGSRENADPSLRPTLNLEYLPASPSTPVQYPRQLDYLDRGMVVMRRSTNEAYIGWRMLGTDPTDVSFNVYRSANGSGPVKLNSSPITNSTNFVDNSGTGFNSAATNSYFVRPIIDGVELGPSESFTLQANTPLRQYLNIPLQIPPGGQQPDAANPGQFVNYTYTANDATVADLDGDGAYEIILKWMPSNEAGAGSDGFTGPIIFDAYKLDGTRMWRINLGINIRAGAQYSAFTAYDFDGDGKAELVSRTMPGTIDGLGNNVILPGDDPNADYRNSTGRIVTGPEYLTVFNGETGAAMSTVPFLPDRGDISSWGDDYGHRGENLLFAPAYLDGMRPSIVVGRGIFGPQSGFDARNELTAWTWRDGQLTLDWWFKADVGIDNVNSNYIAQGVYSMIPADVDGDGKDEIVFGAMVVDDDGTGLYSTGRGHGDALHVSDMDPSNPGLEIFMPKKIHRLAIIPLRWCVTVRQVKFSLLRSSHPPTSPRAAFPTSVGASRSTSIPTIRDMNSGTATTSSSTTCMAIQFTPSPAICIKTLACGGMPICCAKHSITPPSAIGITTRTVDKTWCRSPTAALTTVRDSRRTMERRALPRSPAISWAIGARK